MGEMDVRVKSHDLDDDVAFMIFLYLGHFGCSQVVGQCDLLLLLVFLRS